MNKVIQLATVVAFLFIANILTAQNNVGIGTTSPNPSAKLDVKSNSQGFLPPRMVAADRDAINAPSTGLMIYCLNCGSEGGEPQFYNGNNWLNINGNPVSEALEIGDMFAGGIIYDIFEVGDAEYVIGEYHGKICATEDQSTSIKWTTSDYYTTSVPLPYATNSDDGFANSNSIVAQTGFVPPVSGWDTYAAGKCRGYSTVGDGGLDDWYLPSINELNLMRSNIGQGNALGLGNVGGFASAWYWHSTEFSNSLAGAQFFGNGATNAIGKDNNYNARAVREF